jgi:two-component system LytT family response regulator
MPTDKHATCLIVDDNRFNLEVLSDLLTENHPELHILAKAENGTQAVHLIEKMQPDIVFLDVEMPDMNGFEVLQHTKTIDFQTIFTTAHSHYAIQAIRFNALDYLVKPIEAKELAAALKRFRSTARAAFNQDQVQQALQNLETDQPQDMILYLPTQEGGIKLKLSNIVLVEGERNYSIIHQVNGKKKVSSKTLGHFEEILDGKGFFRCHRSFVVNHAHIDRLDKDAFVLHTKAEVPISRRRKTAAREWFGGY